MLSCHGSTDLTWALAHEQKQSTLFRRRHLACSVMYAESLVPNRSHPYLKQVSKTLCLCGGYLLCEVILALSVPLQGKRHGLEHSA